MTCSGWQILYQKKQGVGLNSGKFKEIYKMGMKIRVKIHSE